jgi:hypothetical protein
VYVETGGSIPFMGMLGEMFPSAQFLVTGVIGPQANAHGPNEFLHLAFSESLTCCVAAVVAHHYDSKVESFLAAEATTAATMPANDAFCKECNEPMSSEGGCLSPTCGGVVKKKSSRRLSKRTSTKANPTGESAPAQAYNNVGASDKSESGTDCVVM